MTGSRSLHVGFVGSREIHNAGASRPLFGRFKQAVATAMMGAQLVALPAMSVGVALTSSGCSTQEQTQEIVTKGGQTDANGSVTIEINGWNFTINVYDAATNMPVSGLGVLVTAKADRGAYMILDPQGRYPPLIGGADGASKNQIEGALMQALDENPNATNVVLAPPDWGNWACNKAIAQAPAPEDISEAMVANYFGEPQTVKLSELRDTLGQLFDVAAGQAGATITEKGIVFLLDKGLKIAGRTVAKLEEAMSIVGWGTLGVDLCAASHTLEWGNYYRSRCYTDEDNFFVYKLKPWGEIEKLINPDIPILKYFNPVATRSPMFVVIPVTKKGWEPQYAAIHASRYAQDMGGNWALDKTPGFYYVSQVDFKLPPITYYSHYGESTVEMTANACCNFNPTYRIAAGRSLPELFMSKAATSPVTLRDKDDYPVDFFSLEPGVACVGEGYKTSYKTESQPQTNERGGNHHAIAVACGYQPEGYGTQIWDQAGVCLPPKKASCQKWAEFNDDAFHNFIDLSIYGDDLIYGQNIRADYYPSYPKPTISGPVRYINLKTGETKEIQIGTAIASNLWAGKFVFYTVAGDMHLYDIAQNSDTSLPDYGQRIVMGDRKILSLQCVSSTNPRNCIFDLNGKRVSFLPDPPTLQDIKDASFFGSRVTLSGTEVPYINPRVKLYDLNGTDWQDLPIESRRHFLNGDNIAFLDADQVGVYNIPTGNLRHLPASDKTAAELWGFWGEHVLLHYPLDGSLSVLNINSSAKYEIGGSFVERARIYERRVVFTRHAGPNQVWVCDF